MLDPALVLVPGAAAASGVASVELALAATRRRAATRTEIDLIPSRAFDPSVEELTRLASAIASTRRPGPRPTRAADAVRISLVTIPPGRLGYRLCAPADLMAALRPHLPAGLSIREPEPTEPDEDSRAIARYTARREMVLARPDGAALAVLPLDPDPLTAFAKVFSTVGPGEDLTVCFDLMALSHERHAAVREERSEDAPTPRPRARLDLGATWRQVSQPLGAHAVKAPPAPRAPGNTARSRAKATAKPGSPAPLFHVQCLAVAQAATRARAKLLVEAATGAPLRQWASPDGGNWWKPRAIAGRATADWPLVRGGFDTRLESGTFPGARRTPRVASSEILGLLKPPTAKNTHADLRRSGAAAPPPRGLLPFVPGIRPLGIVDGYDGIVGTDWEEFFFGGSMGRSRWGKALALETPIPTPWGWTTMSEIREGDQVFSETGEVCTVTLATLVMENHDCYEVTLSDGEVLTADADHLWLTHDAGVRKSLGAQRAIAGARTTPGRDQRYKMNQPSVVTTAEIAATQRTPDGKHANHAIPMQGPLQLAAAILPVDPYVLGAWLGDGTSEGGGFTCADPEILAEIEQAGYKLTKYPDQSGRRPYAWNIRGLRGGLAGLNLLGNKHIPWQYLRGSEDQRLALLQGLMDTDGNVDRCRCEFTSTNPRLARDTLELARTLGLRATMREGRATLYERDCGPKFVIRFPAIRQVFRLPRKAERVSVKPDAPMRAYRYIINVQPVSSVPVRCIQVDSPSHLYLAGTGFVPTHNTSDEIFKFLSWVADHPWGMGLGGAYVDPAHDAIGLFSAFAASFPGRAWLIDLGRQWEDLWLPCWNPFDARGHTDQEANAAMGAVVSAFQAVTKWSASFAPRATAIITACATALIALARALPAGGPVPTFFQIPTLITDEAWRKAVMRHLPRQIRDWWENEFPRLPKDAPLTVTFLISRLRANVPTAAFLGSRTTLNYRKAMDAGEVLLFGNSRRGDNQDAIPTSLFVRGMLMGGASRADVPADLRRIRCPRFLEVFDEAPTYDGPDLATAMQEHGKYGITTDVLAQSPLKLKPGTLEAIFTNGSAIASTSVSHAAAAAIAAEWQGAGAADIMDTAKYTFLTSVVHDGRRSQAFHVRPTEPHTFFPQDPGALERSLPGDPRYRLATDVVAELDHLDEEILAALGEEPVGRKPPADGGLQVVDL